MMDVCSLCAKSNPYKSLIDHMTETGIVMRILLTESVYSCDVELFRQSFGFSKGKESDVIDFLCYLAAMHDVGKADYRFQRNIMSETAVYLGFRHEYESYVFLKKYWSSITNDSEIVDYFTRIVALHHQKYHDNSDSRLDLQVQAHKKETNTFYKQLNDLFVDLYHPVMPRKIVNADAIGLLLMSLIILSDWISSSDGIFRSNSLESDVLFFLKQSGLYGHDGYRIESYTSVWPYMKKMSPMQYTIQSYFESHSDIPMLCLIEDSPGSGKTEAAFYVASQMMQFYHKTGVYIALPTGATANAMYKRVNTMLDVFSLPSARLVHGHDFMFQGRFNNDATSWFAPKRLALLERNGVGTVDQVLQAVLSVRFSALRLLGLSSKVLIVDEVHAYDFYMLEILTTVLQYCKGCHIPVILLSATLPADKKRELLSVYCDDTFVVQDDYPLVTMCFPGKKAALPVQVPVDASFQRTYRVSFVYDKADAVRQIVTLASFGGCYFYLANTVRSAVEIYKKILAVVPSDVEVILFHARFPMDRRKEIEEQCVSLFGKNGLRPKKAILVATQVIEQSLDIDGDAMFSELAPMDLLIQRIGRVWRHTRNDRHVTEPVLYLVKSDDRVYASDEELVRNTECVLRDEGKITLPDDVRTYIDVVLAGNGSRDAKVHRAQKQTASIVVYPHPEVSIEMSQLFDEIGCQSHFGVDDETSALYKTRLGRSSVEFAIIPRDLYDHIFSSDYLSSDVISSVMSRCVTYYRDAMVSYLSDDNRKKLSRISNVFLFPVDFETDSSYGCHMSDGRCLVCDKEFGFSID